MVAELAVDGGRPVRESLLPYGRQSIDEEDVSAVIECLRSGWVTGGPRVGSFENAIADKLGAKHAVAVSNGTAALHAAVFALGIGPGDEVITTPLTFAASANCIRFQGGTVVFADVQPDTLNIDPAKVRAKITPRTKAVIAVDYAGQPADLDELGTLAREHGLAVIEDAAHALGAAYKGRQVGSISRVTTFSFHPVKQITTGEGGVVTTDDAELAALLRRFRNHGITTDFRQREGQVTWLYEMADLGYNYRLSDIQCALGLSQLGKLDAWVTRRQEIAHRYTEVFCALPEVEVPFERKDRRSGWHLYVLRLKLDRLKVGRERVFRALRAENIGVNVHYIPVPWHPYYQKLGYGRGQWPVAEDAYERLLSLPLWPRMTDADVSDVIEAVCKVVSAYRK